MKTQRRRRVEAKTDYKARLNMLKSEKPRLVVRKSNRYIIAQIVKSDIAQDKTLVKFSSRDLLNKGWPKELSGSLKSKQAAYLTGFAIGKLSPEKSLIFDIGLNRNAQKSRIFSVLKGALDAGLNIPHSPESLPDLKDLESNDKLKDILKKIKEKI